jgi:uncharacterized protein (DUF2147 family)
MNSVAKYFGALSVALLATIPAIAADPSPVGSWQVTTGEARYKVTSCGSGALCAKLIWLRADQRTSEKVAFLNTYVVKGARPAADHQWAGNVVFEGHSYDGTMTLVSKNFMTLKGCSGILCQTYEFTRI